MLFPVSQWVVVLTMFGKINKIYNKAYNNVAETTTKILRHQDYENAQAVMENFPKDLSTRALVIAQSHPE